MLNIQRLFLVGFILLASACGTAITPSTLPTATPAPTTLPSQTATAVKTATALPTATATATIIPVTYIPPACQGKPIATIPPATTIAQPTPSLTANPPIARDQQLRVFDALVARINEVYLYPDFNGKDWQAIVARYRAQVVSGLETEAFYAHMSKLVAELGDDHSRFESPAQKAASEARLAGNNTYVGIGFLVQPLLEKNRGTILSVFPDSSAAHNKLKPHDSILAADGLPIVENGNVYLQRVRGPECSAVVLTVQSPGGSPRRLTVLRARVSAPLAVDARLVKTSDGSRIGYVFIPTFFDETIPRQVKKALEDFGALDGLILDNRMNGGGSSTVMEPLLRYFVSGVLGSFESRTGRQTLSLVPDPVNNSQRAPLVVLISKNTVSYAEVFSGALQDSGRAKLVGQTTKGNIETLHRVNLPDGSRAWIAQERFDPARSHANWEKNGVKPDVEAAADWDTFTFENDPGIAAALKLLGRDN